MTEERELWADSNVAMIGATAALADLSIAAAGLILAIVTAIAVSWVALVEVLR